MRPWIGPLAFWLIGCGSSSTQKTTSTGITAADENPVYLDFAPQASSDGQRLVFLSRRDSGAFRVYLYSESSDPKLIQLSKAIALEPATDELATSLSDDGNWILTWRNGTEKNYLVLNSFDQSQQVTLSLSAEARLRELTLAPSGQHYFAYTERKSGVDSVHIYSFTPGTPPTTAEEAVISGEYGAQFAFMGSDIYVFTRKPAADGQVTVQYRKRTSSGAWDLQPGDLKLESADATVPSAASALGLIHAKTLGSPRLKPKLGTFENPPEGYQKNVGVIQEALQFQAFSPTAVDFSKETYRRYQPFALGSISATADGAYLLLSGYEAWFCKAKSQTSNVMVLVRVSDGLTLPLLPTRESGQESWSGVVSEPCFYHDQAAIEKPLDFDVTAVNGQILSVVGSRVTIAFESKHTSDREIRRLSFDVTDWSARTYANPVFTEISAHHK